MKESLIFSPITPDELARLIATTVRAELDARTPTAVPPAEVLLTRKEAAQLLGITLPTLRQYTRRGHVTGYRIGTRVRYRRNEVLNDLKRIRTAKQARG